MGTRNIMLEIEQRERECRKAASNDSVREILGFLMRFYIVPMLILVARIILYVAFAAVFALALPAIIDSLLETYDM